MTENPLGSRFFWKVFLGVLVIVAVGGLIVGSLVGGVAEGSRNELIQQRVRDESQLVALLATDPLARWTNTGDDGERTRAAAELERIAARVAQDLEGRRITLLAADGLVLADSHESPGVMDNHGTRPEVLRPGEVVARASRTLQRELLYVAQVVEADGERLGYARVARAAEDVEAELAALRRAVQTGAAVALGIGLILSWLLSTQLTRPLRRIVAALSALGSGERQPRLPVTGRDEVGRLAAAVNDLSEQLEDRIHRLEQVNEQHRAVLGSMEEGVVAVDPEHCLVLINDAAIELLLADHQVDPHGRPIWEITRVPEVVTAVERCVNEHVKVSVEVRVHHGERDLDLAVSAVPLGGAPDGRGCVAVLHDLTEVRRLEVIRRDFVANVSHELKTPLTSMKGFVEAVLEDSEMPDDRRTSFLTKSLDNADRLAAIVSDLLDLARIESDGGTGTRFRPIDLADALQRAIHGQRASAETKNVTLQVDVAGAVPFFGDAQALETAVSNLINNAIRYSPAESRVRIGLLRKDRSILIEVQDDGPGIPPHEQERIFERFYRVDKDRARTLGGTGLGLSIVKHAVAAHGGEVSVESQVGVGSTFRIRLESPARVGS